MSRAAPCSMLEHAATPGPTNLRCARVALPTCALQVSTDVVDVQLESLRRVGVHWADEIQRRLHDTLHERGRRESVLHSLCARRCRASR